MGVRNLMGISEQSGNLIGINLIGIYLNQSHYGLQSTLRAIARG